MAQPVINRSNTPRGKKKTTKRFRFRFSIIILIFALSFGLNFWTFWKGAYSEGVSANPVSDVIKESSTTDSQTDSTAETTVTSDSAVNPENITNPVPESARINSSYFDTCAFIGDSTMMGIGSYGFVDTKNVYTARGLRPDQLPNTKITTESYGDILVIDALKQALPKNVYILLGSNGVAWLDNNKIISDYKAFIAEVKAALPESDIYIISVFPVGTDVEAKPSPSEGQVLNTQVDAFNAMLLTMANEEKIYYIDVNSTLKDAGGKLAADITNDGTHITKTAYEDVTNYILSHTVAK